MTLFTACCVGNTFAMSCIATRPFRLRVQCRQHYRMLVPQARRVCGALQMPQAHRHSLVLDVCSLEVYAVQALVI